MRVKIEANVLTVETDIPVSVVEKGLTDLTAYDDKKTPLYKVAAGEAGSLTEYGIVANTVSNGNLAVVVVEQIGFERADFIKKYGKAVVAAKKFCPIIANAAATEEEMLNAAFAE